MAPFYMYNNIRGLEQSLIDFLINPEIAEYVLKEICSFLYEYHERLFCAAGGRIDITQVTDDFGSQTGLLISPKVFNYFFEAYYKRFIKLSKNHNIYVFHHDDGAIFDLLPELVDLGIDILNPIQWHLPGMELEKLKGSFGSRLCFHGGVDNQYVLPFGTLREVEEEVRQCVDVLAGNKTGYILAPCHNIQANTPVENILRMYDAAKSIGRF